MKSEFAVIRCMHASPKFFDAPRCITSQFLSLQINMRGPALALSLPSFFLLILIAGARDYLTVTRILSNIIGICLAVIMTHLPPLASATTASCDEYSKVLSCCSDRLSALLCSFLRTCGDQRENESIPALSAPADERKQSMKTYVMSSLTLVQSLEDTVNKKQSIAFKKDNSF